MKEMIEVFCKSCKKVHKVSKCELEKYPSRYETSNQVYQWSRWQKLNFEFRIWLIKATAQARYYKYLISGCISRKVSL